MTLTSAASLPGVIDNRLVALEARDIVRRIDAAAGPLWRCADAFVARGENWLTQRWLARLIRRATAMNNQDEALAWLQRLRSRAAGGTWSFLPDDRGVLTMVESMLPGAGDAAPVDATDTADALMPADPMRAVLFYVPGGGFMLPPTPRQREIAASLAEGFGARAEIGRHRLAPEHHFPVPVDDLCDQYISVMRSGTPPERMIVAGDSAGATLALSMLLALRNRTIAMPAGVLLFSPWTDLAMRGWSYITKGASSDSPFRMETAAFAARLYLHDTLPTDGAASPAYATLEGFPPMTVHCSRYDIHFDDAVRLAEQAEAANVPIRVNYWDSPRHHLERFGSRDANESIRLAADTARGWLDGQV
ncbi:MAG: alpha/beta hydrolase [Rhizobiaceae bacterium]|nr:alpha/beta hydrolase [Rhizobiaceae bacterium]